MTLMITRRMVVSTTANFASRSTSRFRVRNLFWGIASRRVTAPKSTEEQQKLLQQFWLIEIAALGGDDNLVREEVLQMSSRWGPLMICRHLESSYHCTFCPESPRWDFSIDTQFSEPLNAWKGLAVLALLIAEYAATLRIDGRPPLNPAADRRKFLLSGEASFAKLSLHLPMRSGSDTQRFVTDMLNRWLRGGFVDFVLNWDESPRLAVTTRSLYGALGLQLAAVVAGSHGVWGCDWCGMPHFRQRTPKEGHKANCGSKQCKRDENAAAARGRRANAKSGG